MTTPEQPTSWWNKITPAQAILLIFALLAVVFCFLPWLFVVVVTAIGGATSHG